MSTYLQSKSFEDKWASTSKTAILVPEQMHHHLELTPSKQDEEKKRQWRNQQYGDDIGIHQHNVSDHNMV